MRIAFTWDFLKNDHREWFAKKDGMQATIEQLGAEHSVILFTLSREVRPFTRRHQGITFDFAPTVEVLVERLLAFEPQIVQMNGFNRPVNDLILDKLDPSIITTIYYHGGPLEEKNARRVDALIVAHPVQAEALPDAFHVAIIPHTVDTEFFCLAVHATPQVSLLSVGNYVPIKRHELVIRTAILLGVTAEVVGPPIDLDYVRSLDRLVADAGAKERIRLTRYIDPAALADRYRRSKLLLHCSSTEAGPRVVPEAMASGLPCIVTDDDPFGARNFIEEGVTGLVLPPDPEAMAAAIDPLLADPILRARMGEAARCHAEQQLDNRVMFEKIKALFLSLSRRRAA